MKYYNYTIVEEYKQKIVIPIIGLEFEGWFIFIACLFGTITGTAVLGFVLSLLLGTGAYFISFVLSFVAMMIVSNLSTTKDQDIGRTPFETFLYTQLLKRKCVVDQDGVPHYLKTQKGALIVNAHRKSIHRR